MIKIYLLVGISVVMLMMAFSTAALAENPAMFVVTVSIATEASIDVIQGGPIDFGVMSTGDAAVSGSAVIIRNSGSGGNQTYSLALANPASWTAVTTTPGADEYRLSGAFDSDGVLSWNPVNHALTTSSVASTGTKFAGDETGTAVPHNADRNLYLKMETPSATSSASEKSIQVTVTASVD